MKSTVSKSILTIILPLAIFFAAGVVAAWAWDGEETCDTLGEKCCCCSAASGGSDAPAKTAGSGPCGSPKSDCGCDDARPTSESVVRIIKPGRISDDPDITPAQAPGEQRAEYAEFVRSASADGQNPDTYSERYLLNKSFLC